MSHDIDERIRHGFVRPMTSNELAASFDQVEGRRVGQSETPTSSGAPRRHRSVRVGMVMAAAALLVAGVAVAAEPELITNIFPSDSSSGRMEGIAGPSSRPTPPLPDGLADLVGQMDRTGDPLMLDGTRVLLEHKEGAVNVQLYAIPRKSGEVCQLWYGTFGGGGCANSTFADDEVVNFSVHEDSVSGRLALTAIEGIATDAVTKVDVVMSSGATQVTIKGINSFLWYPVAFNSLETSESIDAAPAPVERPVALEIHLKNGEVQRRQIRPAV
jgi:hypothetical protein